MSALHGSQIATLYLAASLTAFAAYGVDKGAAKLGIRRIPEKYLHLIALSCGWPGALLAQRVFRHKCSKRSFLNVFWAVSSLNCATLILVLFAT